jgi:hypothetical protein
VGLLTPLATAALIAQSLVIVALVHLPKGFWNSNGGVEFPLSLAAGVVALAGTGSGSTSLDAALGLSYSAEVRGVLIAVGVLGALVALAISARSASGAPSGSRATLARLRLAVARTLAAVQCPGSGFLASGRGRRRLAAPP